MYQPCVEKTLTIQRFTLRPRLGWNKPDCVGKWDLQIGRACESQRFVKFFNSVNVRTVKKYISEYTGEGMEDILVFFMHNGVYVVAEDEQVIVDDCVFLKFRLQSDLLH